MGWLITGPEGKAYRESQRSWRNYNIGLIRTKEEILAHVASGPAQKEKHNDRRILGWRDRLGLKLILVCFQYLWVKKLEHFIRIFYHNHL